jgi:hypothetical protein
MVNEEATIPCLLLCHQTRCLKRLEIFVVLHVRSNLHLICLCTDMQVRTSVALSLCFRAVEGFS